MKNIGRRRLNLLNKSELKKLSKMSKETKSIYDSWADEYDKDLMTIMDYKTPTKMANLMKVSLLPNDKIIDIGCGTGLMGEAINHLNIENIKYAGIDLSAKSLKVAHKKKIYYKLTQGDITTTLPYRTNSFTVAVCCGVFEYFKDIAPILKEIKRVASDLIIFNFPTTKPPYLNSHSRKEVLASMKKIGVGRVEDETRFLAWKSGYRNTVKDIYSTGMIVDIEGK